MTSGTGPLAHHLDRFTAIDAKVDALVDVVRNPTLDHLFYALSSAADHSILWHAVGLVESARTRSLAPARRLSKVLAIESALTNGPIKMLFRRPRPERDVVVGPDGAAEPLPYGMRIPITSSFPSGHATAAFCAAMVLTDDDGSPVWFSLAALVAGSRVYVRMHHASDVIGGAILGVALGTVLRRIVP
jgi:membrane-associated phospholipid phosphatase